MDDLVVEWDRAIHATRERWNDPADRALRSPATELDVQALEERLGRGLPPSYRRFLLLTNGTDVPPEGGTRVTDGFLRCADVEWLATADPSRLMQPNFTPHDQTILEQLTSQQSDTPRLADFEHRGACLLIVPPSWEILVVLNPLVQTPDGEWECWELDAVDLPPKAFRSFASYLQSVVARLTTPSEEPVWEPPPIEEVRRRLSGSYRLEPLRLLHHLDPTDAVAIAQEAWDRSTDTQYRSAMLGKLVASSEPAMVDWIIDTVAQWEQRPLGLNASNASRPVAYRLWERVGEPVFLAAALRTADRRPEPPTSALIDAAVALLEDPSAAEAADGKAVEVSFRIVATYTDNPLARLEPLIDTLRMHPAMRSALAEALMACAPTGRTLDFVCHQTHAHKLRHLADKVDPDVLASVSARQVELAAIHGTTVAELAHHREPEATALILTYLEPETSTPEPIEPALSPGPYRRTQTPPADNEEAVQALLAQRTPDSLDALAAMAGPSHHAALALAMANDPRAIEPLSRLLDHHDPAMQRRAAEHLASMRPPVTAPLIAAAERSSSEDLRAIAANAVARVDLGHPFLAEWAHDGTLQTQLVWYWQNGQGQPT